LEACRRLEDEVIVPFEKIFQDLSLSDRSYFAYAEFFTGKPVERTFKHVFQFEDIELTQYGAALSDWSTHTNNELQSYFRKLQWLS
jgi:hypothetical protein